MTERIVTSLVLTLSLLSGTAVVTTVAGDAPIQTSDADRIDVSKLGPQVGERVPDFSLNDQFGKSWTLQSMMGPKGAMLVFYRSADW